MKRLREQSFECTKSELDLFHTPETQTAILSGKWIELKQEGALDGDVPVVFYHAGDGEKYYDLANSYVYFQVQIVDDKLAAIPANANVAPVNLFLHSMFSQLDITENDKLITQSTNTYPYRAMFETLLNYSQDCKDSFLGASLYYKDTAGKMESWGADNIGWTQRKKWSEKSKIFEVFGKLHADIFLQDRLILNNVSMRIKLTRQDPKFCLMGEETVKISTVATPISYKIKLLNASMFLRQALVNPDVLIGHALALEKTNAKYPIKKVEMKMFNISAGTSTVYQTLANGIMPLRVVFAMVEGESYSGKITKNPFNFQHFNLASVELKINGDSAFSRSKLDFTKGLTLLGYYSLFTGIDKLHEGNNITRDEYNNGYCLFAYDLTSDLCSGAHLDLIEKGSLTLELTFEKSLITTVSVVVYLEYQQIIEITKERDVILDYAI